jgi:radical SAM protein with 4Fe4S-binding SPASM domain
MDGALERIGWVDEYVRRIAPFVRVRAHDSVLIKIPNQVFRLNPAGVVLLGRMLAGESVAAVLGPVADREAAARDIHDFFCDLAALLKSELREGQPRRAVEEIPFTLRYHTLPVLSEIALTYRCNLACRFCYAACGCRRGEEEPDLGTTEIQSILDVIVEEAEVPSVSFTGGEPTLRPDLAALVGHAKSRGMWTNLITNGTRLTRGLVQALREAGLDSVQVSLEGGEAGLHDAIVRRPGAFVRTVAGIRRVQEAGIRVHTNTTISALNRDHLQGIIGLVLSLGLPRFSMNMLMPEGAAARNLAETFISYSEIGPLVLKARSLAEAAGLEFMWYSPTPVCIFNPIAHGLGNKGCAACDGLLSVSPAGDILPCSSYPKPMGNILAARGRFKALWESREFRYFQDKQFAHERCRRCPDLVVCNGGCPLYWERAGYGEIAGLAAQPREIPPGTFPTSREHGDRSRLAMRAPTEV